MTKLETKPMPESKARKLARQELAKLREQMEDLHDYLCLLDARARDQGKPHLSVAEVRQSLGLK